MEKRNVKQNEPATDFKNNGIGAHFEVVGKCLVIRLDQELDHHIALNLREKADKLIERGNVKNIVFDFERSGFMDSSGIGVIMGRYKKVIFTGGKVSVTSVNSAVDRIFRLSGLYKIIEKYETIQDALKAM
ncbi:SpoIIAA-like anti-anti-sigma regulatory factor [Mobilisporobacter senegalensis]|uniref:Anti-sigma F factor antagonist n=1 Tax=Mobilisporobacter senegalensis TaxID=1329262 RepID=A0A3N1XKT5_9FIRM|nr:anti-sigma F factor antagonist [Mobilisporobacter senegalensis]ROR27315.1 SpoIIAA-like anti-anti-sigma regulatory factor [Mobilisporobacter senegalensis]